MGWFKKEEEQTAEEEIQELPELPAPNEFSLPEPPDSNEQPYLPELSNPDLNLEPENMPQLPQLPELKTSPAIIKQEKIKPHEMQKSQFRAIDIRPKQKSNLIREIDEINPKINTSTKNSEPIYVRLDKFETSLQSLEEIKRKIAEIEDILKRTKDIKQKEEQELETWEREAHLIRARIDAIDKTIFNKLD